MLRQRAVRPRLRALETVVVGIKPHQVHSEFPPSDDLVQERLFVSLGGIGSVRSQCHRNRTDVAKVQIWRQPASVVTLRLVALRAVALQIAPDNSSSNRRAAALPPRQPEAGESERS